MQQPNLFDGPAPPALPDQAARDFAVDPSNDVVLEASAGTGKTRVLVDRYVRLIDAGVDPANILAITFTRKAAAEMRDRVVAALAGRRRGVIRPHDLQIQTIDAFCVGLLREFPLEADVDPALQVADDTDTARLTGEALELTLRRGRDRVRRPPRPRARRGRSAGALRRWPRR
jgi:ATP-dependent helicase/nuclease subunit A